MGWQVVGSSRAKLLAGINCPHRKYNGVIGEAFEIEDSSEYAIADMPKGTEERINGLRANAIMADMKRGEKEDTGYAVAQG